MREPSENGLFVLIKAPEADIFFAMRSNTCFRFEKIVSNLAGSSMSNRSYLRLFIANTILRLEDSVKRHDMHSPAKAGASSCNIRMDPRLRGDDSKEESSVLYSCFKLGVVRIDCFNPHHSKKVQDFPIDNNQ